MQVAKAVKYSAIPAGCATVATASDTTGRVADVTIRLLLLAAIVEWRSLRHLA